MFKIFKEKNNPDESLREVRKRLLDTILIIVNLIGIPVVIIGFIEALILNQLITAFLYLAFFSPILFAAVFRKKLSFKFLAFILIIFSYLIALSNLIVYGFSGAAIPILLTMLVFAAIFLNIKYAFIALLISLLTMIITGIFFLQKKLVLDIPLQDLTSQPVAWITSSLVLVFLGSITIISYGIIQKKMLQNLKFSNLQNEELSKLKKSLEKEIEKKNQTEKELLLHREHLEDLVKERTEEYVTVNEELLEANKDLEKFNELFVGREFRIKELKDKVKELKEKLYNK